MNRYLSSLGGENNILHWCSLLWLPGWLSSKESACNAGDMGSIPGLERSPGEGNGNSVFLLGKSHGQRSLAGYSPWCCKESDMTYWLNKSFYNFWNVIHWGFHQCRRSIPYSGRSPGKWNGNPLQYSCLGNPMDRGVLQVVVHRVAKSRTRLSIQACNMEKIYPEG